ncbi:hypothetical protein [uncultured Chryseobacterium sp.]|uniref:hypothetical protein n=1 Tax=uncultured Chryseobacterium sp. TaxID=259322 RepID=UPI0025E45F37|nr:hypothetical protein [uncultured Chryseobacterium sp.]
MKNIPILLFLIINHLYLGQKLEDGFSKPEASVASLSTYVNTPVSYATGIPDISIPLVSMGTHSKEVEINMGLSYHPGNVFSDDRAGEAGLGWSLLGAGGVISREIINGTDERFFRTDISSYAKNEFDDIYYYNFGSQSGKFRFIRNTADNTFEIVKLTPSNIIVEYVRENNNATLLLQSFKITDERGYIYLFDVSGRVANKFGATKGVYKSAFYLTKVYNSRLQELYSLEYQTENRNPPFLYPQDTSIQTCKLKKITSKDYGTIDFEYIKENVSEAFNDPYKINSITVRNKAGDIINKYGFTYSELSGSIMPGKRALKEIRKYSRNLSQSEITAFEYNGNGSTKQYSPTGQFLDYFLCNDGLIHINDPKYFSFGTLKKMKLPSGGSVEYTFETKEYATEGLDNLENYLQNQVNSDFVRSQFEYLKPIANISFDTRSSFQYAFTSTPNSMLYIRFRKLETYPVLIDPNANPDLDYKLLSAQAEIPGEQLCSDDANGEYTRRHSTGNAANHTVKIVSATGGRGVIEIYEKALRTPPYKNAIVDKSLRIEKIRYFDSQDTAVPAKTETFTYDRFDDANTSSGEAFWVNSGEGEMITNPIYRNVQVSNGDTGGYTRYYYKTPSDYPLTTIGATGSHFWPHLNITRSGLLEKKEIYSAQHMLKASENHEYTLQWMGSMPYQTENQNTLTSIIKYHTTHSKVFDSGLRAVATKSETAVSDTGSLSVEMEKTTNAEGGVTEIRYKYPKDKSHAALMAANIVSVPLETEIRKDGIVIGRREMLYENAQILQPTSQIQYMPDNLTIGYKPVRYDQYDEWGNLIQYTGAPEGTDQGFSTTVIWGYNKTVPIAKIEGAKLSDIPQNLIDAIVTASDEDANAIAANAQARENALLAQLEIFKNHSSLSAFSITAYTYDPMIGVTNVLPPNGIRERYIYDSFGRLQKVIDVNGKTLKEYQYNYKQ